MAVLCEYYSSWKSAAQGTPDPETYTYGSFSPQTGCSTSSKECQAGLIQVAPSWSPPDDIVSHCKDCEHACLRAYIAQVDTIESLNKSRISNSKEEFGWHWQYYCVNCTSYIPKNTESHNRTTKSTKADPFSPGSVVVIDPVEMQRKAQEKTQMKIRHLSFESKFHPSLDIDFGNFDRWTFGFSYES